MKLISASAVVAFFILILSCGNNGSETVQVTDKNIDSLIAASPNDISLLLKRGNMRFDDAKYDLALIDAAKAFRLDTNNLDSRMLYADVLMKRASRTPKEVETCQRLFKHIVKKRPKSLRALVGLASTYSFQRDFNNSFKYINMALRINKRYRDGYVLKGTNYMLIGDMEKAISSYETAISQDPEFYEAYLILAQIYQNNNDPQSLEYYRSAAKLKPEYEPELRFYIAYAEQEHGDLEEAKRLYRMMAADSTDGSVVMGLFHQGRIKQMTENDLDSAIYFYKSALVTEPRHIESWHNLGMCYDKKKMKTLALQAFSKALEQNPDYELSRAYADSIRFL